MCSENLAPFARCIQTDCCFKREPLFAQSSLVYLEKLTSLLDAVCQKKFLTSRSVAPIRYRHLLCWQIVLADSIWPIRFSAARCNEFAGLSLELLKNNSQSTDPPPTPIRCSSFLCASLKNASCALFSSCFDTNLPFLRVCCKFWLTNQNLQCIW